MTFHSRSLGERLFVLILLAMGFSLGGLRLAQAAGGGGVTLAVSCALVALALAKLASHLLTEPLEGIIDTLHESARNGRLPPDLPEGSGITEVKHLARAVNSLSRSVRLTQTNLDDTYVQFLETMAEALDARDPYTAGHSLRVAAYACAIARELGLAPKECEMIRTTAQLHDIGKIGIPDVILQKAGRLSPEEFGLIKLHPQIGRKILEKISRFADLLPGVELHHENFDGTGYPYKLAGTRIPMDARIVRVADAFDAMTSTRSYRNGMPLAKAVDELVKYSGTHYDPQVAQAFLYLIARGQQPEMLLQEHGALRPAPMEKVAIWLTG
jgi:putative nucleotidyltransferase with HDIG domain